MVTTETVKIETSWKLVQPDGWFYGPFFEESSMLMRSESLRSQGIDFEVVTERIILEILS